MNQIKKIPTTTLIPTDKEDPKNHSKIKQKKSRVTYKKIVENYRKAKHLPSSKIFNLLLKSAPSPSSFAPLTFQILLLMFQTGLIFSKEFSKIYEKFIPENILKRKSIMNKGSFFNSVSNQLNIIVFIRKIRPEILISILGVFLAFFVLIYSTFWKFEIFLKTIKKNSLNLRSTLVKATTFIRIFSFFITNYDIIFFIFNTISFNSFFCRTIQIEITDGVGEGGNYLDTGFSSAFLNATDRSLNTRIENLNVAFLNDSVECKSTKFYIILALGFFLLILNVLLKIISSRLMKFTPSPDIFSCKYNNSDLILDMVISIILVFRTLIIVFFENDYQTIKVIFYCSFGLLFFTYVFLFKTRPYYNQKYFNLRNFQILYLLNLVGVSILVRETNFDWAKRETSTIIVMIFFLTILVKVNNNFSRDNLEGYFEEIDKGESKRLALKGKILLRIYFKIANFIRLRVEGIEVNEAENEVKDAKFLIYYLLERHKSVCGKIECFCQNSKIFNEKNILRKFEKISNLHFVYEGVMLLDDLFSSSLKKYGGNIGDNIFYTYIHFLINYMGRTKKAYYLIQKIILKKKISSGKNTALNIELAALLDDINLLAIENLEKGVLPLKKHQNYLEDNVEVDLSFVNKMKILDHILFLKKFEKFKRMIYSAMEFKHEFLRLLSLNSPTKVSKVFLISTKFYEEKERIQREFDMLKSVSGNLYAPLFCLFGNFKVEICEDRDQGVKILSKYEKISKNLNLNQIFLNGEFGKGFEEFGVFFVNGSNSKGFHKIEYCTSNMVNWIGWRVDELVDQDLSILIPEPIKSFHHRILELSDSDSGGRKFTENETLSLLTETKSGYLINFELGMRLNTNITNSFQYVGVFNFPKKHQNSVNAIITCKDGIIWGSTFSASALFENGTNLKDYNNMFKDVYEDFNFVSEEQLRRVNIKEEGYHNFIDDEERLESWANYCKWKQCQRINIIDKEGKVRKVFARFDNYIIHQINEYFRFFIIEEIDNQFFEKFRKKSEKNEPEQEKVVKSLLRYKEKQMNLAEYSLESSSRFFEQFNELKEDNDGELVKNPHLMALNSPSISRRTQRMKEKIKKKFFETNQNKLSEIDSYHQDKKLQFKIAQVGQNMMDKGKNFLSQKHMTKNIKSMNHHSQQAKKRVRKNFRIVSKINPKSQGKSEDCGSILKKMRIQSIERLIHKKLNPSKLHKNSKFAILMLTFIFLVNFLSIYLKSPIQKSTAKDIKNHAIAVDVFSWAVWSQISAVFYMEILRMAREGWIDSDISIFYRQKNIFEYATIEFRLAAAFQIKADNMIDEKVRNISKTSLFNFNDWITNEIKMPYLVEYDLQNKFSSKKVSFDEKIQENVKLMGNVNLPRRAALKLIQPFAKKFMMRDYENATVEQIPKFGNPKFRLIDAEEEVVRMSLLGELNKFYTFRSYDYYEYMKGLANYNLNFVFWSTNLTFISCLVVFCVFILVILLEVSKMKDFYKKVLNIKIDDLKPEKVIYEKKFMAMSKVLIEEKVYEKDAEIFFSNNHVQIKKIKTKRRKNRSKNGRNSRNNSNWNKPISLDFSNFFFGLFTSIATFFVLITLFIILQYVNYSITYPQAKRVANLMEVYILGVETWSSFFSLHMFMLETVLYNNSLRVWDNKSSLEVYEYFKTHIEKNVLSNYSDIVEKDLGNFSQPFIYALNKGNSCETVFSYGNYNLTKCPQYYDGLFTSNFISTLKALLSQTTVILKEWEANKKEPWEITKNIINQKKFNTIFSRFGDIMSTIYYWATIDSSNYMMKELDADEVLTRNTSILIYCLTFGFAFVGYFLIVKKIQKIMSGFFAILLVIPVVLIEKNVALRHHLVKKRKGLNIY